MTVTPGDRESDRTSVAAFRALHVPGRPLVLANPWDVGSARLLAGLGFRALATTSSGFAATMGLPDGSITREQAIGHARAVAAAVDVPVSADLENGFGHRPEQVAETVRAAAAAGVAGCSIEDFTGDADAPLYERGLAVERVAAAVAAARAAPGLVLTARTEGFVRGVEDLADTVARVQAFAETGADVVFAPGLSTPAQVRAVVQAVDRPVCVLLRPGLGTVAELAAAGAARVSVGGSFSLVAAGAVARAGRELLAAGTTDFLDLAAEGRAALSGVLHD